MQRPSKVLLGTELIRAAYEYSLSWVFRMPLQFISYSGDNHPVMVIPGLGTSDASTCFMRNFLDSIGYNTYSWGLGRNIGPRRGLENLLNQVVDRVQEISSANNNQQVSIIGWSLGGLYAREVAKEIPEKVRQVISIGTPFKNDKGGTHATFLYEVLSRDKSHKDSNVIRKLAEPPSVPFTSMYSKSDGIVYWKCSIEDCGEFTENIEIPGASHMGLGHNPISMFVLSDRLRYTKETWQPFRFK